MRQLHPVGARERFLASGSYRFIKDGEALPMIESWTIHALPDGEKLVRVDQDGRQMEGKSILAEALLDEDDSLARLDIRYENAKYEGGVKSLRATYQAAAGRLQAGYSMNGGEREYSETDLPPGSLIDIPLLVFRGAAIRKMAGRKGEELTVYAPMFEHAQLVPGVLRTVAPPVEYIGDALVYVGAREVETRRFRYIDRAAAYWIDRHDIIIKRANNFKRREIVVEIRDYAAPAPTARQ